MIDRWDSNDPAIIIADQGYESYNVFAHIQEKGCYFLIRIKDIGSPGIIAAAKVPNTDEFDIFNDLWLTRKQTNGIVKFSQSKDGVHSPGNIRKNDYVQLL